MNGKNIPKLTDIVSFNEKSDEIIINWKKFSRLEELSERKKDERANRNFGYIICYLTRERILVQLEDEEKSFAIIIEGNEKIILNPSRESSNKTGRKEIKYGFAYRKDALNYAKAAYPNRSELKIESYEELKESSEKEDSSLEEYNQEEHSHRIKDYQQAF